MLFMGAPWSPGRWGWGAEKCLWAVWILDVSVQSPFLQGQLLDAGSMDTKVSWPYKTVWRVCRPLGSLTGVTNSLAFLAVLHDNANIEPCGSAQNVYCLNHSFKNRIQSPETFLNQNWISFIHSTLEVKSEERNFVFSNPCRFNSWVHWNKLDAQISREEASVFITM